ncbi:Coronin-7 [Manis pentadactyla]|nr:Coronin-7 [Manis pentadactyla]
MQAQLRLHQWEFYDRTESRVLSRIGNVSSSTRNNESFTYYLYTFDAMYTEAMEDHYFDQAETILEITTPKHRRVILLEPEELFKVLVNGEERNLNYHSAIPQASCWKSESQCVQGGQNNLRETHQGCLAAHPDSLRELEV